MRSQLLRGVDVGLAGGGFRLWLPYGELQRDGWRCVAPLPVFRGKGFGWYQRHSVQRPGLVESQWGGYYWTLSLSKRQQTFQLCSGFHHRLRQRYHCFVTLRRWDNDFTFFQILRLPLDSRDLLFGYIWNSLVQIFPLCVGNSEVINSVRGHIVGNGSYSSLV